jgi:hypothetical protein
MHDLRRIQFVVTSFSYLQGLTAVPYGLALALAGIWANSLTHRAGTSDVLIISTVVAGLLLVAWLASRYYTREYGQALAASPARRMDLATSLAGAILALGAFGLDVSYELPFSAVGLVGAGALLAVYLRAAWLATGKYLLFYPALSAAGLLVSLLPALGQAEWWTRFGIRSQLLAICVVLGFLYIVAGVWGHLLLLRLMPSKRDAHHV